MLKKLKIIIALLVVGSMLFASSCMINFSYFYNHEKKIMDTLSEALETGDKKSVTKLFSKNALKEAENFEGQLEDLFEFFEGTILSVGKPVVNESKFSHRGRVVKKTNATCSVKTTVRDYTFNFCKCTRDTGDRDNVGLVSLRVYPTEDEAFYDPNEGYHPYRPRGYAYNHADDVLDVPGIFTPHAPEVIIENEEDALFKKVVDSLSIWNKCGVQNAFAYTIMDETEGYIEQLNALFDYFEGNYLSFERREYTEKEHFLGETVVTVEVSAVYEVKTDKQDYLFILYSMPKCNADPQMRGIHALRVIRAEDEAQYFPDWSVMETQGIFVPQDETQAKSK